MKLLLSPPFWHSLIIGTTSVEISDLQQDTFSVFISGVLEWGTQCILNAYMYLSY